MMNNLEYRVRILENKRITVLEEKVRILEGILDSLKKINLSGQMGGYIQNRTQTIKMVDLLNSVSDQPPLDFSREEEKIKAIQARKKDLDKQIVKALADLNRFFK